MEDFERIAIIGMSGRFPKADNIDEFWKLIRNKELGITFISDEDLRKEGIPEEQISDPEYVKAKGVLEDVDLFDADFFSYTPREAEFMDPQQRFFLEYCWKALEHAGYANEDRPSNIGVFGGVSFNSYLFNLFSNSKLLETYSFFQAMLVNDRDYLTTRVSYQLDLKGPSLNVQTGCSSSLVAVHLACQSLLSYESDMALAGGVSITLPSKSGYQYRSGGIASPDGFCRAFDAKAKGTVNGNGVGIVMLKRLSEAIEDGDTIYSIIKGSAINNDGLNKIGFTAPGVEGQSKVIVEALGVADVEPETINYIETHGTGTPLGDPIEIRALTRAFETKTKKKNFCAIGSVKSSIGHLDAAAGVTGLIKTTLSLWNKEIPPSLNFETPNPELNIEESPFYVNSELRKWETNGNPRRASISSFGIGGTNAHFVLEEAPDNLEADKTKNRFHILPVSAKTPTALKQSVINLSQALSNDPELNLADTAYCLQVGRKNFEYRTHIVAENTDESTRLLGNLIDKDVAAFEKALLHPQVVFMFPGQGSQKLGMGKELYETEEIFRKYIDQCAEILKPYLDTDIRKILFGDDLSKSDAELRLKQTSYTQPALFVVEFALARLLMEKYKLQPTGFIGHSLGEYVAACLAEVFSLEDALHIVSERGRLMQSQPSGEMLAIGMASDEIKDIFEKNNEKEIAIAGINSPNLTVISGNSKGIQHWKKYFDNEGCFNRVLETSHAFHSPMMEPILTEFEDIISKINLYPPKTKFVSNVTGKRITDEQAVDPKYWSQHIRQAVDFNGGIKSLCEEAQSIFLEVGHGKTLCNLVKHHRDSNDLFEIPLINTNDLSSSSETKSFLNGLGQLWEKGLAIPLSKVYADEKRNRISLPGYPFEKKSFWIKRNTSVDLENDGQNDFAKQSKDNWFYTPTWIKDLIWNEKNVLDEKEHLSKKKIILFADQSKLSKVILKKLNELDFEIVEILHNDAIEKVKVSDNIYQTPISPDNFEYILTDLESTGWKPDFVINLWTCLSNENFSDSLETNLANSDEAIERGFFSLTYFMQAIGHIALAKGQNEIDRNIKIISVTKNLYSILGVEQVAYTQALTTGASLVIPQEYPNVDVQSVDISDFDERTLNTVADQIVSQIEKKSDSPVIAFRGNSCWKRIFEKINPAKLKSAKESNFKQKGVYVITGGLGGIGLEIADYLSTEYDAKIALLSRSELPAEQEWEKLLTEKNSDDKIFRQLKKITEFEQRNAEIKLFKADITDYSETNKAIIEIEKKYGKINGVIHAAGIAGETLLQLTDQSKVENVISPKVKGLLHLDDIFKNRQLDLILLFSSHRSITGGVGGADYSSANAFLDAYARANNTNDRKVISIIWDGWTEIGMAVETARRLKLNPSHAIETGVNISEGLDSLETTANLPLSEIIVSTHDFQKVIERSKLKSSFDTDTIPSSEEEFTGKSSVNNRPNLSNEYVEPETDTEKIIAEIWQQLLGISPIGTKDNFFELGGDSVLCIQVVAQANKRGLSLTAQHVFNHQTITELTLAINIKSSLKPEQDLVTGHLPLTPIQQWYFEQHTEDVNHFNQSMLFKINEKVETDSLKLATQELISHHDALRMQFSRDTNKWIQHNNPIGNEIPFESISVKESDSPIDEMIKIGQQTQQSLNLAKGEIFKIVHFDLGEDKSARLLLVCHHLVIDAISWRFVMEDLFAIYEAIRKDEKIKLPAKTFSFKKWAVELEKLAQSEQIIEDADYWLDIASKNIESPASKFIKDLSQNTVESETTTQRTLDKDTTEYLLQEAVPSLRIQINEIILTTVVKGISNWSNQKSLLVDIEGHGRDFPIDEIDATRTCGWFTTIYPVLFEPKNADIGNVLRDIKDQVRNVPNKGNNFGLLRYLRKDKSIRNELSQIPEADLSFLYLGKMEGSESESGASISRASENIGNLINRKSIRTHLFTFLAYVQNSQLHIELSYSKNLFQQTDIAELMDTFIDLFKEIKLYAEKPDDTVISATDFPDAEFETEDLENLLSQVNQQNFS